MQHPAEAPLDLLAGYLEKATDLCKNISGLPEELQTCLQKASTLVEGYKLSAVKSTEKGDHGSLFKNTPSGFTEDSKTTALHIYKLLLHLTGAKNVLQLQDYSGSNCLALADDLPEDGNIVVCTTEAYAEETSSHGKKLQAEVGNTMDILKRFAFSGEKFDVVFIDATEQNGINYYNLIMSSNMLKRNGVICVRSAYMEEQQCQEHKEPTARDMTGAEMEQVHLPVDGGITILRRKTVYPDMDLKEGVMTDTVFCGLNGRPILDRLRLDGKVAYVTGGGQGIGRAFAHALGEAGAKVAIIDICLEKAETVAKELHVKGIKSVAMAADISKEEDVRTIVDTIVTNWGRIDIACNNAGINMNSPSENTTLEEWDKTFNVNLRGLFMCCQAAGRVMLSQGYGKIINTASMASLIVPHPQKQLAYNTSKAGVVKLTQTLGTEWIDRGVRVNCISPGIVDTPLIHSDSLKPLVQRWLADIPAGRLAQVTDLQAAVVYLASEASDYMTGHNLVIDGGQSLW
ncbi:uncharacterized protein O3C94_013536 [Discoglossus pictus]